MSQPPSPSGAAALFGPGPFRLFWTARFLDLLAVPMQAVTLAWQVYQIARDHLHLSVEQAALQVGIVGLAQFLPLFALTLNAGAAADRTDRRLIMGLCIGVEMVSVIVLAALTAGGLRTLWPIFALAAVFGAARAFFNPASTALAPMLVPRELLPRAIAWNAINWQAAAIIGPAVGGLLCAVSPALSYAVVAGLYALSLLFLLAMRANTRPEPRHESRVALIKEGIAYVWREKIVLGATSLDLFAVLLGGATALLPVYARDVLHVGPTGFGVLRSAPAVGATAVAGWLAFRPLRRHAGPMMFTGVAVFGLATIVFALSKVMALSLVALVVLGGADMISVYVRQTLIQLVTPDPMRGRVAAVSTLFVGASNELGEFESGVIARFLGPVGAALFGGIGALVVTGLWARLFPSLRKADRLV
ncbi:MAG TPA: MFS transporter [Caulobacteraceae bacterium]|jgi:MFS family permease